MLGQEFYETMLRNGLITELESRKNLENVVVVMHPALITSREMCIRDRPRSVLRKGHTVV